MTHFMKLAKEPFEAIDKGLKSVEVRLYDQKRQKINIGDTILFTQINTENVIETKVLDLLRFKSFAQLYENVNPVLLGYKKGDKADYKDMYKYYNKEDETYYGVLAITIKKLY